jgi:Mrp family chromosome partitioning ATPase
MTDVIVGLSGLADEPELVKVARDVGLTVVRRCVDSVDMLGAAAADPTMPVVLSAVLPRLTADVVGRLGSRVVVGVATDSLGRDRLERLGVPTVLLTEPTARATMQQVADVCRAQASMARGPVDESEALVGSQAAAPPDVSPAGGGTSHRSAPMTGPSGSGRLVAVWGPMGAPGRTTIAVGIAEALAERGARVCLIDADTYAPSVALALGLVEETSGLAAACRQAEAGVLTPTALATTCMSVGGGRGQWRILGGIGRVDRWVDVRPAALDRLWAAARQAFDVVVVDVGFCLEVDDSPGAWGRQRNAAAVSALSEADHLVAVGDDSGLGAARLLAAWPIVEERSGALATTLVRNRSTGRGGDWRSAVRLTLPAHPIVDVPDDPRAMRASWRRGRSLGEAARRSRARRAMGAIASSAVSG